MTALAKSLAVDRARRLALPALLIANLALACGPWLVRLAGSEAQVGPVTSAFWRLALALPLLLVANRRAPAAPRPDGRRLALAAIAAGLFFATDLGLWHIGILHTRLANATLLANVTAILFPIYGFIAARHLPTRRQGAALALAAAGAMLLLGRSYELSARNLIGDLACIAAGLAYTGYLIAIDRARRGLGPVATLTWTVAAGVPFLLVAAIAAGGPIWPQSWLPLVLLALGSQIVGQGLILFAVGRVSALIVGLMLLVQPIVASAIGWIAYGERLTALDLIGGCAIAAAVLLVRRGEPRLPAPPSGVSSPA